MSLAVKRYSTALFETCVEHDCLNEVKEQFSAVISSLNSQPDFNKFILTNAVSKEEKKEFFNIALKDGNVFFRNFMSVLTDSDRIEEIKEIYVEFEALYKQELNILEVSAVTAIELTEEELLNLKDKLATKYNKNIVLSNTVDPSIIGGMVLYVGDRMLDASVRSKLNGMKQYMKEIKIS